MAVTSFVIWIQAGFDLTNLAGGAILKIEGALPNTYYRSALDIRFEVIAILVRELAVTSFLLEYISSKYPRSIYRSVSNQNM